LISDVASDKHNFPSDGPSGKIMVKSMPDYNKLLFSVFSILQKLGADERPEVLFVISQSYLSRYYFVV
jgi:hypothetical protein